MGEQQTNSSGPLTQPGGIWAGAMYPFRAMLLFRRHPYLRRYIVIPLGVNLVVGILLYAAILIPGLQGITGLVARLPDWAHWLAIVLQTLLVSGLLLVISLLLVQFGGILGAPWYGQLSEQIELIQTGQRPPSEPWSLTSIGRDIGRAILFELKKLCLILGIVLLLLPLGFFPPIGPVITSVGSVALSATIVCLDFLDPALERRRLRFRRKLSLVFQHGLTSTGFALICLGLISIPLMNLMAIPLCVAAGTLFFCDRLWSRL